MKLVKGHPKWYRSQNSLTLLWTRRSIPALKYEGKKAIVYKKAWAYHYARQDWPYNDLYVIITLEIGAHTLVAQPKGYKCRAASAKVVAITGLNNGKSYRRARSCHNNRFIYRVGDTVRPDNRFDPDPHQVCCSGIHFFLTRKQAEGYPL